MIWNFWKKIHPPLSNLPSSNSGNTQGLFVLVLSPRAIPQTTWRYLPRGAWKFPCSTGAELEIPNAAVVTSNAIDKVGPVARTEERKRVGRMGRKEGPRAARACGPLISSQTTLFASVPTPAQPHLSLLNHPPWQCPSPTSPAFLLQGPKAPELEQPRARMKLAQWVCLIHIRAGEKGHIL